VTGKPKYVAANMELKTYSGTVPLLVV